MMYCSNCGHEIDDRAVICPHCGVPTQGRVQQREQVNVLAIIGFALSFCIAIAGLVCSILGLKKANEMGGNGHGLALAGMIVSIVEIALSVVALIIMFFIIGGIIAAIPSLI